VLMVGLPRSGKSTYVNQYLPSHQLVCPDDIRKGLGVRHDRRLEPFVWAVVEAQIRALMERERPVVLDATNTIEQVRTKWIEIAKSYGYSIKIVWIDTPLSVCMERAKLDNFPESVMIRMYRQLKRDPPVPKPEIYELVHIKFDEEEPERPCTTGWK